jgi:hypothetical protein
MRMIEDIPFPELDGLLARFYLGMVEQNFIWFHYFQPLFVFPYIVPSMTCLAEIIIFPSQFDHFHWHSKNDMECFCKVLLVNIFVRLHI